MLFFGSLANGMYPNSFCDGCGGIGFVVDLKDKATPTKWKYLTIDDHSSPHETDMKWGNPAVHTIDIEGSKHCFVVVFSKQKMYKREGCRCTIAVWF